MENLELRFIAKAANVPLWKIADKLGISENTMTRMLRKPIDSAKRETIIKIINEIKEDQKNGSI